MTDDPVKPPRFPYVAALLCAACVGMAGYTWMRYSYCWDFSIRELEERKINGLYVRVSGYHNVLLMDIDLLSESPRDPELRRYTPPYIAVHFQPGDEFIPGRIPGYAERNDGGRATVRGRTTYRDEQRDDGIILGESRFTGASIAGLVVGAMGCFVFTVALRHWLGERRRFRERDERA
jgi:hypothetical protein